MCGLATPQVEAKAEPLATPDLSWENVDPQPMPLTFPLPQADEICDDDSISQTILEAERDEDGAESEDLELKLSDEEEHSTILVSSHKAAKPPVAEEDSKLTVLSPLDMDMLDMCKRATPRLSIPWPAVQTEVVKSCLLLVIMIT